MGALLPLCLAVGASKSRPAPHRGLTATAPRDTGVVPHSLLVIGLTRRHRGACLHDQLRELTSESEDGGLGALGAASEVELVESVRVGKEAEALLYAPAPDGVARPTLESQLARGIEAWNRLFDLHWPTLAAFCRSKMMRRDPGAPPARLASRIAARALTVEEFANVVWTQGWEQYKTATWRGEGPFKAWYWTVLQSIWAEWYRTQAREDPTELARESRDDREVGADETAGEVGPSARVFDEAGESEPARDGVPAALAEAHRRAVERLSANRRVVYRLAYSLPLSEEDRRHIAERNGRSRAESDALVARLHQRYGAAAEEQETEALAEPEKRYRLILGLERKLETLHQEHKRLLATSDVVLDGAPGDPDPRTVWRKENALRDVEKQIADACERLDGAWRRQHEARERILKAKRAPSREVAEVLNFTPANVDQVLRRAELDVAIFLTAEDWHVKSARKPR